MEQETRFQMRCDPAFLKALDRLKAKFGVRSRPEVVRIAIMRLIAEEFPTKPKEKR